MFELNTLHDFMINLLLAGTRIGVALYTVPFFHQSTLLPMVRNAMIISFTIPVLPLILSYQLPRQEVAMYLLALIAKEALLGFILGFVIGIVFWAAQNAGNLIDTQRGAFFAIMQDPLTKADTTPLGNFFFQLSTILFFICGGFREIIGAIIESYQIWPIHRYFPEINHNLVVFFAQQLIRCLNLTVIFAAPVLISAFLADLALGVLNRFAPEMNIFMISLPLKSAIASFVLVLYITFFVKYLQGNFMDAQAFLQIISKVIR